MLAYPYAALAKKHGDVPTEQGLFVIWQPELNTWQQQGIVE